MTRIIGRALEQLKDRRTFPQHKPAQGRAGVFHEWGAHIIVIFNSGSERLGYAKTDVSAKADSAETRTWLYGTHGHQSRATHTQGTTAKGAPPANGLGGILCCRKSTGSRGRRTLRGYDDMDAHRAANC